MLREWVNKLFGNKESREKRSTEREKKIIRTGEELEEPYV